MRISPKYSAHDWHRLTFQTEEEWHQGVDIFQERVRERFLNPISRIEDCPYSGFAVLALDCLLIEMLQQFREGVERTPSGMSKLFFVKFLTESSFGEAFDKKKAERFYRQIRCGILHQAEIRGRSRILVDDEVPLVAYTDDQKGLLVNRRVFHRMLMQEFQSYIDELLVPGNEDLRAKFIKKMKHICKTACEII
ncbi:MAG: hypothetical protein JSV44_05255 [Candidatus Zixiibacteriota bacterium]|nr:MAG: hypothetical protein JSV44_05255 [candidate division Zixibacteria bacterium]